MIIYHGIHFLEVYYFSVFTELYSYYHNLIFKHFPLPKKKCCADWQCLSVFPSPQQPLIFSGLLKNITIIWKNYKLLPFPVTYLCVCSQIFFICFNQIMYHSKLMLKQVYKSSCLLWSWTWRIFAQCKTYSSHWNVCFGKYSYLYKYTYTIYN